MRNKRFIFSLALSSFLLSLLGVFAVNAVSGYSADSGDDKIKFFNYGNGLGAGGYDVVAYFESHQATKGEAVYEVEFADITWRFASEKNRGEFIADPGKYLPQYGGHCAYGVAQGYLVRGDPQAWSIKDGKLYFNYNKNIRNAWLADAERFLRLSENNWMQLNIS